MVGGHQHSGSTASDAPPCPDPSVHEKSHKISEAASAAALLATNPDHKHNSPLDADGKLSAASAATSLKYAKPQDLPSFPSLGGTTADSAGKAAMLAKDYKMKELWQPELSTAGSKAALLAHGKGSNLDFWQPTASAEGSSAATLAFRNQNSSPQVPQAGSSTPDYKSNALLAATASHNRNRQRAESTPAEPYPSYPDSHNSSANALSAATASHRTSTLKGGSDGWDSDAMQAARVHNLHMDPSMFGEHPPVQPEVDEATHNAALHASAVTLAKQMYGLQNRAAQQAAENASQNQSTADANSVSPDIKQQALQYISLQDTAHRLAAERLAKVDKSLENDRYRQYYGYGNEDKSKRLSSRLSVRNALGRGRASSEGDHYDDSDDELQANKIRSQMSQLNSGINQIDAKKQQDDRAKLMAAAEKRVSAQMHALDERVFLQTGKVPPAMLEEWEEKSRKRAAEEREEKARHPGKTHIGGGKYMDQAEIEAIALARLKPTLDELNDTAEKRRARDEELRLEKERQDDARLAEKEKTRLQKEEFKRIQNEDKAVAKREKEEAKARKEEEKRLAKEEKRKSQYDAKDAAAAGAAGATLAEVADKVKDDDDVEDEVDETNKKRRSFLGGFSGFRSLRGREDKNKEKDEKHKSRSEAKEAAVAGATLSEVAEKVKHDQEEPTPTPAVVEAEEERKHHSLLAKLKGGDKEAKHAQDEEKPSKVDKKEAAAAVAAGAVLAEVADKVKHDQEEPVSPIETEEEQRERKSLLAKLKRNKDDKEAAKAEPVVVVPRTEEEEREHKSLLAKLKEKKEEHDAAKAEKAEIKQAEKAEKIDAKEAAVAVAAGATLGEVAEKVKHDQEESTTENEGVNKHRSALAALKEKLSKDKDAKDPEVESSAKEPKAESHAGAATAAGVVGGAATGAVLADVAHDSKALDAQQAEHANAATTENDASAPAAAQGMEFLPVVPVEQGPAPTAAATSEGVKDSNFLAVAPVDPTVPETHSESAAATSAPTIVEPETSKPVKDDELPVARSDAIPFEQQGALSRFSNDAVPTLATTRPDLERHISQIPENDDDEDDEDDDIIAAVAKSTQPQPETVEEPQTRAGKIGAAIAKGVAPMASSFGPTVPYHESATDEKDDEKAAAQAKTVTDKVGSVFAGNTALASSFAPVAAVKPSQASATSAQESAPDPLEEQRFKPEQQQAGPTVVGSGGSIAKGESSRPGTSETVTPANTAEGEKKGLKGFFNKLKPKSGKENSEKLPEFKSVAQQDKEAATVAALARPSTEQKSSAPVAGPAPTVAAIEATSEAGIVPGTLTTWQKPTPLPVNPGTETEIPATAPSTATANPTTATLANTAPAAPATTAHDDDEDDDDENKPGRASRLAAALGLKPKKDQNKLHKRSLDEHPARGASVAGTETEDDEDNFYDADQGVTPVAQNPPASILSGTSTDRKETKFTENL